MEAFAGLRKDYRVLVADPAWDFKSNSKERPGRNARRHYDTMSLDEIAALPGTRRRG
jgi:N6-adenosine-specific RNA methylase IME4